MREKYLCIICENECSMAHCQTLSAEEIEGLLALWKICTKHSQELDQLHAEKEKREIAQTVY